MKKKSIIIIALIAVIVLIALVVLLYALERNSAIKLNKTTDIKEDKVKLTVLSSEKVTINRESLEKDGFVWENESNGEYVKVKLTIENYGDADYTFGGTTFYLGDKSISLFAMSEDDYIDQTISSGKTATGYIYFPVVDSNKMTYYTHPEAINSNLGKYNKYIFRIK